MHTLRSSCTGLLLGALVLSLGGTASAAYPTCDRQPTAEDVEGAKGAHKAAQRFYDKAQYQEAIRNWTDAYSFDCTAHPLLINIGNAYEKLGDRAKAVEAFEIYLSRMGAGADPTIPDKVQNLKAQLERDRTPPTPTATAEPTSTAPPPPPPPPGGDDEAVSGPGPWPWVLVGGGAAFVVAGAVMLGVGSSRYSQAKDDCGGSPSSCEITEPAPRQDAIDRGNSGRTLQGAGYIVGGVGLAAIGGGLLWYFLSPDEPEATSTATAWHLAPVLGPEVQGLTVGARF